MGIHVLVVLLPVLLGAPSFELSRQGQGCPSIDDCASFAGRKFANELSLADVNVHAIAIDSAARLVIGTQSGLGVFNGVAWRKLGLKTSLRSTYVRRLMLDAQGRLWIGTAGAGLVILDSAKGTELTFDQQTGLPSNEVTAMLQDTSGRVWLGTPAGARLRDGENWKALPRVADARVDAICAAPDGIWVASGATLHRYDAQSAEHIASLRVDDEVRSCALVGTSLWLGGEKHLWRQTVAGSFAKHEGAAKSSQFYTMTVGVWRDQPTLFVGNENGELLTIRGEQTRTEQVSKAAVLSLFFTRDGPPLLWVGTSEGLLRKNLFGWKSFREGPELLRSRVKGIARDRAGALWLGGENGVAKLGSNEWGAYQANKELGDSNVYSLSADADGSILIGTRKGLLLRSRGDRFETLPLPTIANQSVQRAFRTSAGTLTVGTRNGLYEVTPHTTLWRNSQNSTLGEGMVYDFAERRYQGRVLEFWIATDSVLHRERQGVLNRFGGSDGLPNDNVNCLRALGSADLTQALWIGTNGGGALRLGFTGDEVSPNSRQVFSTESVPPIVNNVINSLAADAQGRMYVFTNKGVSRISATGSDGSQTFTSVDGLFDDEAMLGAALVDDKQRVWVGTAAGVSFLDPTDDFVDASPKKLFFDHVLVNDQPAGAIEKMPLREDRLRFEYALLDYFKGDQAEFKTQLIGAENTPSDWSKESSRAFTALRHGSYIFQVWARDYLGREVGPIEKAFVVLPPPYLTWWAYGLYALVVASGMFGVGRLRNQQLRRRAQELEQQVQNRTIEIRRQKDEIEIQKADLELSQKQADRIFNALKQAMPGRIINDRYQIAEKIGEGGFGAVYRGQDVRDSSTFAIKIFKPQAGNDSPEALERFKGEAKNASRVTHPNAVKIHDFGVSEDGVAFIVMDLLVGHSIEQELKAKKRFELTRALTIVRETCDVLAVAHELGIVHRDVKPDNVFLHRPDPNGREIVKVLDFGVAKAMKGDVAKRSITMTGAVVGTPTYMAPERLQDSPYDGRSDVYAVGIILYEMLCGHPPFESKAENVFSVVMAHLTQAPPLLTDFDKSIPVAVQDAVMAALSKDPEARPTAAAYRDMLDALLKELDRRNHA